MKDPDWEIELTGVEERTSPGVGRVLNPSFVFKSRFPGTKAARLISGDQHEAVGSRGTRSGIEAHKGYDGSEVFGYAMPADEPMIKFRYRLNYREDYPFPRASTTFIGKGEVAADGKSIDLKIDRNRLGLDSVEAGTIGPKKPSRFPGKHSFDLTMEGEWKSQREQSAAVSRYGQSAEWRLFLFLDEGDFSSGAIRFQASGFHNDQFDWSGSWTGDLKPGMKVELGITAVKRERIIEFVVDRADLIRK